MSDVAAKLIWQSGLKFTGLNSGGLETAIDGDRQAGASPMDLLLEAVGACSAVDVVMILQKQRTPPERLEVSLEGERHSPEPRYYTMIRARFDLWGELSPAKVERAISLSFAKYCSVFHSLRPDLKLQPEYRIHGVGEAAQGNYQAVTIESL
ncbi:MAG TPA: OsmC family protein [Blastocatellia bacterium]|nr:OsmC family protein [Blastocatellia bacterium]